MSGKKPSPPDLEIDFLETGHEDRYMQEVFDHIDRVPDKEPLPKITLGKKNKEKQYKNKSIIVVIFNIGS